MSYLENNTDKIIQILVHNQLSFEEITVILQITVPINGKYISLKLRELNHKKKIVYIFYYNIVYWKLSQPEFEIADERISPSNMFIDFYRQLLKDNYGEIEAWNELAEWYRYADQYNKEVIC